MLRVSDIVNMGGGNAHTNRDHSTLVTSISFYGLYAISIYN